MIVDPKDLTIIGETNFRSMRKKFGIKRDDRRRHVYIIGKSGSGKSVLLENMIMQDIKNGNGCCIMDPHGDLAEKIINFIPDDRINDVVYFNPSDIEYPIAFNILEGAKTDSSKNLVASGLIGIFKKMWADSWGPRLEYILRNTILSLMYDENSTLLGINKMLIDKEYRKSILEKVEDPIIKAFWLQEYEAYPAKELSMIISPIQNKVGQFLSNSLVRNILGQVKSTIDLRDIMDNKKILLVNLAKGRIGEDNSSLIGSMLVTKIYLAAMSRVDVPEEERNDFYLYVDEFQNFATESFADILSEARKYRLSITMAHQYIAQLPEVVSDAIFGNGGTMIAFRLGPQDAEILEKEFSPDFMIEDLVNIPKWNVVLKMLIDGVVSKPFSAATLPPISDDNEQTKTRERANKIIETSRQKYARNRKDVEEIINQWTLGDIKDNKQKEVKKQEEKAEKPNVKMYDTNCWVCGMKMSVPFEPDNKRPIYCSDCLKKVREKLIPEPKENRFQKILEKQKPQQQQNKINKIEREEKKVNNKPSQPRPVEIKKEEKNIDTEQEEDLQHFIINMAQEVKKDKPQQQKPIETHNDEILDNNIKVISLSELKNKDFKDIKEDLNKKDEDNTIQPRKVIKLE